MPQRYNRDIIVVSPKALIDENSFQQEIEFLKDILYNVEDVFFVAKSAEVIDLNTNRVIRKQFNIVRCMCNGQTHPFTFIINRN